MSVRVLDIERDPILLVRNSFELLHLRYYQLEILSLRTKEIWLNALLAGELGFQPASNLLRNVLAPKSRITPSGNYLNTVWFPNNRPRGYAKDRNVRGAPRQNREPSA